MERIPRMRQLALGGMVGPWLWSAIVVLLTPLEYGTLAGFGWTPGGSHGVNYPSSLALGRFGWAQILNFGLFGVLLIGLAVGLYRAVRPRSIARVGPVLLAIAGVGLLLSMFPTDHGPPNAPSTWHGDIHAIAFLVVFIPLLLSMFFFAVSFRHDPRWTGLVWVGPISGAAALIAFIGLGALLPASLDQVSFYAALLALFVGITVIAYRLRALYPRDNVTPGSENLPPR